MTENKGKENTVKKRIEIKQLKSIEMNRNYARNVGIKKHHHTMTPTSAPTAMLRLLNAAPSRRIKGHFRHFVGSNLLGEGNADNDGVNASP